MSTTFNSNGVRYEVAVGLLETQLAIVSEAIGREDSKEERDEFTIAYLMGQSNHLENTIDTLSPQNQKGVEQAIKKYS